MSFDSEALIYCLIPRIYAARVAQPGLEFRRVVSKDGKRRHAVLSVVLELIVAPDHAKIRLKIVERAARGAKTVDHRSAMRVGMPLPIIHAPLPAHRLRPILDRAQALRQRGIG